MTPKKQKKMDAFELLLKRASLSLVSLDMAKTRMPIRTDIKSISYKEMRNILAPFSTSSSKFRILLPTFFAQEKFEKFVVDYCNYKDIIVDPNKKAMKPVPEEYKNLTLNIDHSYQGNSFKFFMTTPDEYVSEISGKSYLGAREIPDDQAIHMARKVIPLYEPRREPGIFPYSGLSGENLDGFNTYVPPDWFKIVKETKSLPHPPKLFSDLVDHLFPHESERQYFYSWLYYALYERAPVYLILCGKGGVGKNTLQLVLRALFGFSNFVNGKKSSLQERFNSQFAESTLVWFDELRYDMDMENALKELPNDSISIEKKGVDATRSTTIHASFIISNNKPRDNYLAFDARKFSPLVLNNKRLEKSMAPERIDKLVGKVVKRGSDTYDVGFLARIAKWLYEYAPRDLYPNLEYRGPMFWRLAHTSMSRWQKSAATLILSTSPGGVGKLAQSYDKKKGFKWSLAEEESGKKKGRPNDTLADYSTVKHFFDVFRDGKGEQVFKTEYINGDPMGDFYVKVIKKDVSILNEADVIGEIEGVNGKEESSKEEGDSKASKKKFGNGEKGSGGSSKRREAGTGRRKYIKVKNLARGTTG